MTNQRAIQLEQSKNRVSALEENLKIAMDTRTNSLDEIGGGLSKIEEYFSDSLAQKEEMLERGRNELKQFENRVMDCFEEEQIEKRATEKRLVSALEDKIGSMKVDLAQEASTREKSVATLQENLEVRLVLLISSWIERVAWNTREDKKLDDREGRVQ